jgi:hypothetical protein
MGGREMSEDHSIMLGRIASIVGEFCNEEDTTLMGVAKLRAIYHDVAAREAWDFVEKLKREQNKNAD